MERTHHPQLSTTAGKKDRRETNKGNYIQDIGRSGERLKIGSVQVTKSRNAEMPTRRDREGTINENDELTHYMHTKEESEKKWQMITTHFCFCLKFCLNTFISL